MYRKAFRRPGVPSRRRAVEQKGRWAIPRDDGRARLFESMVLLSTVAILAVALGFAVGVPLALMLGDFCSRIAC